MKRLVLVILSIVILMSSCTKTEDKLKVYNWGDYIDEDIISNFTEEYGIEVSYETYGSNEDLYVKIKNSGEAYDVIFPSEYMASKMIKEGLLYKYDIESLSNYKNMADSFKNLPYDENNEYCVPYFWGTMGLLYNKNLVDEEDMNSFACIFDEKYKGQIFLFDAQRDVIGLGLKYLGYSLNSKNEAELNEAKKLMTKQKRYLKAYAEDNMKSFMLLEEGAIGYTDSGVAFLIITEEGPENFGYKIPKEGSNLWVDLMCIPASSRHKEEAKLFINYLMREDVAQKNLEYIQYPSPLKTVTNPLPDDPELWDSLQATKEEIARCEVYTDLGDFTKKYNDAWIYIKANDE